jgi:hypothetical protein
MVYFALESKNTNNYKYYYFQEQTGDEVKVTENPEEAYAFHHTKDAKVFLLENPDLVERFEVVGLTGNPKFHD